MTQQMWWYVTACELMEHQTLKNVNIGLNTNIYSYLETFGGQSSNLYLNVGSFFQHQS